MATLHTTVEYTRKTLIGSAVIIGSIFLIIGLFRLSIFLKEVIAPTPPPEPKASFGKLTNIEFPPNTTEEPLAYTIETVSGFLPQLQDRINVYRLIHDEESNLFDLNRARNRVSEIEFTAPEKKISETVFEWTNPVGGKRIVYDTLSLNYIYTTDFFNNEEILNATTPIDTNTAIEKAEEFLEKINPFPEDIDRNKTKTQLLSIVGNDLLPASSISNTNIVRIDFFQKDINSIPILYSKPNQSTMNVFIANLRFTPVEANYTHQSISDDFSDYPTKTVDEAYKDLQDGNAYIASHANMATTVKIRDVFYAYYLGEKKQDYLMPVIVFTDNDGFYAYVSAVKNDFVK